MLTEQITDVNICDVYEEQKEKTYMKNTRKNIYEEREDDICHPLTVFP